MRGAAALCAALLLRGAAAAGPSPRCQAAADAYCATGCKIVSDPKRDCDGPLVARDSGPSPVEWRCYSPSTLRDNETYASGTCYCSRDAQIGAVLAECASNATAPVPVFAAGEGGSKCYRIPTVIRTAAGTLLAFAEARLTGCGDGGGHNLVARRSADDGATWGPIVAVVGGGGDALSNPNPVEVALPDGRRAVLLHYDTMNNPKASHHGSNMQVWSYDDGVTWGNTSNITRFLPASMPGAMPGPSVGIQQGGRIYFSAHGVGHGNVLYWSDDLGATWAHGDIIEGLNECSIAPLANGSVAMNCRSGDARSQLTFSAGGARVSAVMHPGGLADPNCQGSLLSHGGALRLSNDATTSGRSHLTVKRSTDSGVTWDAGELVWAGPSAYSQLVGLSGGRLGVLFELGHSSPYEQIGLAVVG